MNIDLILFVKAIISVQSAWRGHNTRQIHLATLSSRDQNGNTDEDDISLIQSAYRGHVSRRKVLKKMEKER